MGKTFNFEIRGGGNFFQLMKNGGASIFSVLKRGKGLFRLLKREENGVFWDSSFPKNTKIQISFKIQGGLDSFQVEKWGQGIFLVFENEGKIHFSVFETGRKNFIKHPN